MRIDFLSNVLLLQMTRREWMSLNRAIAYGGLVIVNANILNTQIRRKYI